ncbi:MAG: chemotaxis protein CheW, partial [Burkholderiales bacterium]
CVAESPKGWLLSLGAGRLVAVGERELVHILAELPKLQPIPRAPAHARHAMVWQERILPVIDLSALLDKSESGPSTPISVIGIVAFRGARKGTIGLGALALHDVPQRLETSDSDACEMPSRLHALSAWAISCLDHPDHGAVPILNLSNLYAVAPELAMGAA